MADNISKFIVDGEDRLTPIFDKVGKSVESLDKRMGKMGGTLIASMVKTHIILKSFDAIRDAFGKTADLFRTGLEVNIETEKTMLGISATLATVYDFQDAVNGIKLEGVDKFNASMKVSEGIMRRLTISAITTAASVKDVTEAFSATVAIGAQSGLKPEQVERMSSMVANASKVFGLTEGQASQELRALLTGKIDQTSTIGKALGLGPGGSLRKEFQEALKTGGDFLSDFMDKTLSEYSRAAETMSQRLSGMFDAGKETYKLFAKDITVSMGDELLKLKDVINNLFFVDKKKGIYQWSEDLKPLMGLLSYIGKLIGETIVGAVKGLINGAIALGKYFQEHPIILNTIVNTLKTAVSVIGNLFSTASGIFGTIVTVLDYIASALVNLFDPIAKILLGWFGINTEMDKSLEKEKEFTGPTKLMKVWNGFLIGVSVGTAMIADLWNNLGQTIVKAFTTVTIVVYKLIKSAFDFLADQALTILSFLTSKLRDISPTGFLIPKGLTDKVASTLAGGIGVKTEDAEWIKKQQAILDEINKDLSKTWTSTKKANEDALKTVENLMNKNPVKEEVKKAEELRKKREEEFNILNKKKDVEYDNLKLLEKQLGTSKKQYDFELKLWDLYNSYGLIQLQTYFDRKSELQKKSYEEEKASILKVIGEYQKIASKNFGQKSEDSVKAYEDAQVKLAENQNKLKQLENDYFYESQKNWFENRKAIIQANNELSNFNADMYDLMGFSREAQIIKLRVEIEGLKEKYMANPEMITRIEEMEKLKLLNIELAAEEKKYNLGLKDRSQLLEKLNIQRETGQVGEIGYLLQVKQYNSDNIRALKETIAAREKLADTEEEKQAIQELRIELEKLESTADPIKTKFDALFKDGFESGFIGVIEGTKSVADAFKDLAKSIEREITRLVASELFTSFSKNVLKGGSSGGGFFDSLGSMASSFIGSLFGGKASGGLIAGPTLVGETGPELFFPSTKGFIMNAPKTQEYIGKSSQPVYNINVQVVANDLPSFRNSEVQLANAVQRAISKGNKMN